MAALSSASIEPSRISNFKGKLFTYTQTHGFEAPNYSFQNEGFQHAPCYRVTVDVAGHTFISPKSFRRLKDAEQFVSKMALESLSHQTPTNEIPTSFLKDSKLCKTILYEYCVKNGKMSFPKYDVNVPESGPSTLFISKVEFDNNTFVGSICKSKKEAEQSAACAAITALLKNSETGCLMSEVVQKFMPATAVHVGSHVGKHKRPAEVTEKNLSLVCGRWLIPNNTCKSILKEYHDMKGGQDVLQYTTHTDECRSLQAFVSSVSLEGNIYHGPPSKSKKEAEQAAAYFAVKSILGNPISRNFMLQAIQSKIKLDLSWDVNNPSTNLSLNKVSTALNHMSTNPNIVGYCSVTSVEPLQGKAPVGSILGQCEEMVETPLLPVGSSMNSRKRARSI